jgi:hypothetical protein
MRIFYGFSVTRRIIHSATWADLLGRRGWFVRASGQLLCAIAASLCSFSGKPVFKGQLIQASVDIEGTLQDVRSASGGLTPYHGPMRGVYVQKEVTNGGPWRIDINTREGLPSAKHNCRTDLLANLFPVTQWEVGRLACRQVVFAPIDKHIREALPAVVVILCLSNQGDQVFEGKIHFPDGFHHRMSTQFAMNEAQQAGIHWFDSHLEESQDGWRFELQPEQGLQFCLAFLIASGYQGLSQAQEALARTDALQWLNSSLDFHQERLGDLSLSNAYYAEALVRMEELCRQSELYAPDGAFVGGTLGSNVYPEPQEWWNQWVWMKDNFYGALPMALFHPELCEKAISFFLEWGVPQKTRGRGLERFPNAEPVTNSLSNSLSGLVLASAYYQATGNTEYFFNHPFFLKRLHEILDQILGTRQFPEITLFPSMYVSDGDARGDFHTGSNLVGWYAFKGMARLCREVFGDIASANRYQQIGEQIRSDILKYCSGEGISGHQYFEGAYRDGSFVLCHDGEESDVALMPFYVWDDSSDPALLSFSQLGFTAVNPHYSPEVDGIAWFDGGYGSKSTFPGFTSALAGARTETELQAALERIRRLTDLDGSIWWWPHRLECRSPSQVSRYPLKCCWAAAVYVLKFVHDILGIQFDQPAHQVSLRPFVPWDSFTWRNCQLGYSRFDFSFLRQTDRVTGSITNHNGDLYTANIDLLLPAGVQAVTYQVNDEMYSMEQVRFYLRYQRPCYRTVKTLHPGETLRLEISYQPFG